MAIKVIGTTVIDDSRNIGNVGIATITTLKITGAFKDSADSSGTTGQVLQSTVSGTQWTSSAGIGFVVSTNPSGSYSISQNDNGEVISNSGTGWTIPTGLSIGFNATLFNNTTGNQTITPSGVTLYIAGTNITSVSAFDQRGLATLVCVATNTFVISGAGLR